MTANQINYWNLQETKRANVARETENTRHNTATEALGSQTLQETTRHNKAGELISQGTLNENTRHNVATEQFNISQLAEQSRHNVEQERVARQQASETQRHNIQTEELTEWNNRATATLRQKELIFSKDKETQRINEWIQQFTEAVRQHNIDGAKALLSNGFTYLGGSTMSKLLGTNYSQNLGSSGITGYDNSIIDGILAGIFGIPGVFSKLSGTNTSSNRKGVSSTFKAQNRSFSSAGRSR